MPHQQVTLDLLKGVEHDTHQDQQRRTAIEMGKILRDAARTANAGRIATAARKMAPGNVIFDKMLSINSAVCFPGFMPGTNPPLRFKLSAMSFDGTVIAV